MRLYSYVVARDYGFAPNPFYGYCTLATCMPVIRRTAQVGDWVVGTGSVTKGLDGRLVFAMRVDETMTYNEYWADDRFARKRPNLSGSLKQRYGDNIYHRPDPYAAWIQEDSHHSHENGVPNRWNIAHDTKTDRVLVSQTFTYWGGEGPLIPKLFRDWNGVDVVHKDRGYRVAVFPDDLRDAFVQWLQDEHDRGVIGEPYDW